MLTDGTVAARVGAGFVGSAAEIKFEWVPNTEADALAASAARISLPREAMGSSDDATLTVYFRPEANGPTSKAGGGVRSAKLPGGIDPSQLHARVRIGAEGVLALITDLRRDPGEDAYVVTLRSSELRAAWGVWQAQAPTSSGVPSARGQIVELFIDIRRAVDGSGASRKLYRWGSSGPIDPVIDLFVPDPSRIPLVLVHGIQVGPTEACGATVAYEETWQDFAHRFQSDDALRSRYELYTFQYPTEESIAQNGRWLAQRLSERFQSRPVVVVAHSMGGLVTRAADVLHSRVEEAPMTGDTFDIGLARVITLDTPHLGTPDINRLAMGRHVLCGNVQGARDLSWSELGAPQCDNPFLCDPVRGINVHTRHLKRYVAYSSSFELPVSTAAALEAAARVFAYSDAVDIALGTLRDNECRERRAMCISRAMQLASQLQLTPEARRSGGDGAVLVKSQRMQRWNEAIWEDPIYFLDQEHFEGIDHLQVTRHADVFRSVRDRLLGFVPATPVPWLPGIPTAPGTRNSGTGGLAFSWGSSHGATSYRFQLLDLTSQTTTNLVTSEQATPLIPLTPGHSYRWTVASCNDLGCSLDSAPLYFQAVEHVPVVGLDLSLSVLGVRTDVFAGDQASITLRFINQGNVAGGTTYRVSINQSTSSEAGARVVLSELTPDVSPGQVLELLDTRIPTAGLAPGIYQLWLTGGHGVTNQTRIAIRVRARTTTGEA